MIFLVDTCFWSHIEILYNEGQIDLQPVLEHYQWGMTIDVKNELEHHNLMEFIPQNQAQLIPINEKEWSLFLRRYPFLEEYDKADQSLLLVAIKDTDIILTDDNALFLEADALGLPVFLLPLFVINQSRNNIITKKLARKCLNFWEKFELYPKREIKKWKNFVV
jgi:hypothetical protein